MSLVLILLLVVLWLAGQSSDLAAPYSLSGGLLVFFGFYVLLVLLTGVWSRWLAGRVTGGDLNSTVKKFRRTMVYARLAIPLVFAAGVFWLGWGYVVRRCLDVTPVAVLDSPGLIIGMIPAFAAWMGLWWSQYPLDRAMTEQGLLLQLDANLPVRSPPRFSEFFSSHLRTQLLFAFVPILLVVVLRDLGIVFVRAVRPEIASAEWVDVALSFGAMAIGYIVAPALLRRVLQTESLADTPLRRRLQRLADRTGFHARDLLLWRTNNAVANAAVMGVVPRFRYVLLSDLLLQTMSDDQVEAVFAHEVGHVRAAHMPWYAVLIVAITLAWVGPGLLLEQWLGHWLTDTRMIALIGLALSVGSFLAAFGWVSRRFERQADVFAARTLDGERPAARVTVIPELQLSQVLASLPRNVTIPPVLRPDMPPDTGSRVVTPYGATVFCSALHRVAAVNGIPTERHEWLHGSIASRMRFIRHLAGDPSASILFDRTMLRLRIGLAVLLVVSAVGAYWMGAS